MNGTTRPISARASVSANPMYMLDWISPRASGCLAMASTPWPKIKPMPMPGPIAARPYATAPMLMLMTCLGVAAARWTRSSMMRFLYDRASGCAGECGQVACAPEGADGRPVLRRATSVPRFQRTADVLSGQDREDIGLQRLDQHLERGQHEREDEGSHAEQQADAQAEQVPRGEGKDQQQDTPREHVREQPDGQGEWPDEDVLQDLDRRQDDQD